MEGLPRHHSENTNGCIAIRAKEFIHNSYDEDNDKWSSIEHGGFKIEPKLLDIDESGQKKLTDLNTVGYHLLGFVLTDIQKPEEVHILQHDAIRTIDDFVYSPTVTDKGELAITRISSSKYMPNHFRHAA